jgi:hypothetical protein
VGEVGQPKEEMVRNQEDSWSSGRSMCVWRVVCVGWGPCQQVDGVHMIVDRVFS